MTEDMSIGVTALERETTDRMADGAKIDSSKRRQILDGARTVFLAKGFDGASMGEIARVAGVSKGTLYVYFDSKETLFEALTVAEKRSLAEALFSLDESDADVHAVLRRLGCSFLELMLKPDHVSAVRMVIGAADKFPRFGRAFYEAGPCRGILRLQAYFDRQVDAGRLTIGDTHVAARQFLELCSASVFRQRLFGLTETAPDPAELAKTVDEALYVFFAAYGPKHGPVATRILPQ